MLAGELRLKLVIVFIRVLTYIIILETFSGGKAQK